MREGSALEIQERRPLPFPVYRLKPPHGFSTVSRPVGLPDWGISFPLWLLFSLGSLFYQTGFYTGGKKKLPSLLFSQVPSGGTRASQCSCLRLPSWTVAVKQERFQRRPIPTVDVRTGRPRLFQRQTELMTVSLLKTGQGGKLRIWSLMSRPGQDPKSQGFQT